MPSRQITPVEKKHSLPLVLRDFYVFAQSQMAPWTKWHKKLWQALSRAEPGHDGMKSDSAAGTPSHHPPARVPDPGMSETVPSLPWGFTVQDAKPFT